MNVRYPGPDDEVVVEGHVWPRGQVVRVPGRVGAALARDHGFERVSVADPDSRSVVDLASLGVG